MGFIATLGIIALAGMIIRNSVILVDQIEHERARGVEPWQAVVDATMHRFRPIMLTAAAAILGMIPIMHDVFWGPMAYAIVGGLAVATALTLVFLPALYVTVNGIREPDEATAAVESIRGGRSRSPALTVRRRCRSAAASFPFLRLDPIMSAQSEVSRDYADKMLLSALEEAHASVRFYDTKAQIVGVGYILALNVVLHFGDLLPNQCSDRPAVLRGGLADRHHADHSVWPGRHRDRRQHAHGGNNLTFGEGLHHVAESLVERFPIGIELNLVSDQPEVVREAIGEFTKALVEAVAIVLAVSFVSLGLRAGIVVALSIPLVLVIVFGAMEAMGISLQRISLGALIIALGLLVDDAMITTEMMISKIEEGMDKMKAATFAFTSTAFPMLTGTLVTVFGFLPIGFADNNTGQYTYSLFAVIAVALIASWFVAVLFAPVIGVAVLPSHMKGHDTAEPGRLMRVFARLLGLAMRHRWLTIGASLIAFGASVYGMGFVQKQFFPASNRPELLVTMTLPKNASIAATEATTERLEEALAGDADIVRFSSNVGGGAIRFYLPLDVQLDNDFIAQTVVVARDLEARDRVQAKLGSLLANDFPDVMARISRLELGPPVGWPVQYRVSAPTTAEARHHAEEVGRLLRASGLVQNVNYDWAEKSKELRIVVDQDRVRQAGLSSEQLAQALNRVISGSTVTQLRELDLSRRRRRARRDRRTGERRSPAQSPDHDADRRLRAPARAREV